jgi:hypothetical protein
MPTEYRFDELDLREEPARGDSALDGPTLMPSGNCTAGCASYSCPTNADMCCV